MSEARFVIKVVAREHTAWIGPKPSPRAPVRIIGAREQAESFATRSDAQAAISAMRWHFEREGFTFDIEPQSAEQ